MVIELEAPLRCSGKGDCGKTTVCSYRVYAGGYCMNPEERTKAVEKMKEEVENEVENEIVDEVWE